MKYFLAILLLTVPVFAQDSNPVPDVQVQLNTLNKRVDELASQVNAIINRINSLPPSTSQSTAQANAYKEVCTKAGLKFTGIEVNSKTSDIIVRCQ